MSTQDKDLEKLLESLEFKASETQVAGWKRAVSRELSQQRALRLSPRSYGLRQWAPVVAALFVGFLVGGLTFTYFSKVAPSIENISQESSATIETIYAKAE